jgi:hypothetical protein
MVTWTGLLCALCIVAGLCLAALGGLVAWAAGRSDASGGSSRGGHITFLVGAALVVTGVLGLVL